MHAWNSDQKNVQKLSQLQSSHNNWCHTYSVGMLERAILNLWKPIHPSQYVPPHHHYSWVRKHRVSEMSWLFIILCH